MIIFDTVSGSIFRWFCHYKSSFCWGFFFVFSLLPCIGRKKKKLYLEKTRLNPIYIVCNAPDSNGLCIFVIFFFFPFMSMRARIYPVHIFNNFSMFLWREEKKKKTQPNNICCVMPYILELLLVSLMYISFVFIFILSFGAISTAIMELPMFYLVWKLDKYAVDVQQTDISERVAYIAESTQYFRKKKENYWEMLFWRENENNCETGIVFLKHREY